MSYFDLTTVVQVQTWAGSIAASNVAQVSALISSVSAQILNDFSRTTLLPFAYSQTMNGQGTAGIMLPNWPVLSVSSLVVDGGLIPAAAANAAGVAPGYGWVLEPADALPPSNPQMLFIRGYSGFGRGLMNVSLSYVAGYQVSGEAATVPSGGGTVTVQQPYGAWGSDRGVTYASTGLPLQAVAGAPATGQYAFSAEKYTFASADAGKGVLISYGYIPLDVAMACAQWVEESISYSTRIGQRSKSLGGQETMAYDLSPIPGGVNRALQPYRRVAHI